jgi:hypothetical protein
MSQVIELSDAVFTKLVRTAEKLGVSPENWIEAAVEEKAVLLDLPKFSEAEREEMHFYSKNLDRRLREILKAKLRKQGLELS